MVRRSFTPEQIINKLREAEVHLSQGDTVGVASRKIGVLDPSPQIRRHGPYRQRGRGRSLLPRHHCL